jgi:hypothetical protein
VLAFAAGIILIVGFLVLPLVSIYLLFKSFL